MLWCKNRVSDQLGRTYVGNLILTPIEIQIDTLKPDATNNMQLFQDFDNEGFDVYLTFHNESLNTDKRPSAHNNNAPGSANERERLGRGGPRPYVRNSGVCYPFGFKYYSEHHWKASDTSWFS